MHPSVVTSDVDLRVASQSHLSESPEVECSSGAGSATATASAPVEDVYKLVLLAGQVRSHVDVRSRSQMFRQHAKCVSGTDIVNYLRATQVQCCCGYHCERCAL